MFPAILTAGEEWTLPVSHSPARDSVGDKSSRKEAITSQNVLKRALCHLPVWSNITKLFRDLN